MNQLLNFFILLPILGFLLSLVIPAKMETAISWTSFLTVGIHLVIAVIFTVYWVFHGHPTLNIKDIDLFKNDEYDFAFNLYFDKITAVYLLMGSFLTFLVTLYSRYYMHREKGYKRFFNTILFFYVGYTTAVFAGNFETLFIGWEVLGLASFLLIAFYRERYLPVKNAVKVFSIYRIGDLGLILAMWMSHHLWHENITFLKLSNFELVHEHLQNHSFIGVYISLAILITAAAKSAQLPFSSWLPRAMEGPTPSSAIFYGSLSVHLGVFLLMRTFPFWEQQISVRILIGLVGLVTAIITTGIARVQSSVKSQVAYGSISQIGLIFIEVALGFENFALFHLMGNAFLRTYQLLVSPSMVSYLIREQFYNFIPNQKTIESRFFSKKIQNTFYILCTKEWNLDSYMYQYLWNPLKVGGKQLNFLTVKKVITFFVITYSIGLLSVYHKEFVPPIIVAFLPFTFGLIGFVMVLKSFTERRSAKLSWVLIMMNHFWVALAVSFNEDFTFTDIHLYLSGVIVAGIIGFVIIDRLKKMDASVDLDKFHGYSFVYPKMAFVFLLACLGVSGFPITPTFIGEDLIFTHIHENQIALATLIALSILLDGLAIIRIYARLFIGPYTKAAQEVAYRSS